MAKVTPRKVAEGIQLCIANAERYLSSADVLSSKDKQGSYLLFLYALEEMGKVVLVSNALFYETDEQWSKWKAKFKDHAQKMWYSRDLDDIARGDTAKQENVSDKAKAKKKLEVAYVDLVNDSFVPPQAVSDEDLQSIRLVASSRLTFLKGNHPSVEYDEARFTAWYPRLRNASLSDLEKILEERRDADI